MDSRVVPGGNAFAILVEPRRNVRMRTIEDYERLLISLEQFAVRIGFGEMSADVKLTIGEPRENWNVGSERPVFSGGDQNGKRVRLQKRQGDGIVFNAIEFWNVQVTPIQRVSLSVAQPKEDVTAAAAA